MNFWQIWLLKLVTWLQKFLPQKPAVALITFTTTEGVEKLAEITVPDDTGSLSASVSFKDVHGHDTPAQDVPTWSSSDESVVSLAASEDGLSATATIVGPGASLIEVISMTDDGDEIKAQGTVTVTAGEPATSEVTFSEATSEEPTPEEPPVEEGNGGETEPTPA